MMTTILTISDACKDIMTERRRHGGVSVMTFRKELNLSYIISVLTTFFVMNKSFLSQNP